MVKFLELLLAINSRKCDKQILQNGNYSTLMIKIQHQYLAISNGLQAIIQYEKKPLWVTAFTV